MAFDRLNRLLKNTSRTSASLIKEIAPRGITVATR